MPTQSTTQQSQVPVLRLKPQIFQRKQNVKLIFQSKLHGYTVHQ